MAISWIGFKIAGWKVEGHPPNLPKYVLIGAPHTSAWDFPLALGAAFLLRLDFYWLGKASMFKGLLGPVMRWFGGSPVDRSKSNNLVQATIETFKQRDRLIVVIAPEGTRADVTEWKRGFYHIAYGAGVPIGLAFVDFDRKIVGFGPTCHPTGDMEKDVAEIRAFYKGIKGKPSAR